MLAGAFQITLALSLPALAETPKGADGGPIGVREIGTDGLPVATALWAVTVTS